MKIYRIVCIAKRKKRSKIKPFSKERYKYIRIGNPVMLKKNTPVCFDLHRIRIMYMPFDFMFYIADDNVHHYNKIPLSFARELIPKEFSPRVKTNTCWVRYDIVNSLARLTERRHLG